MGQTSQDRLCRMTGNIFNCRVNIDPLDPDHLPKSLKILDIVSHQQAGEVISQHGGHDIGVMDLFAAFLKISHQLDELYGDSSPIVRHLKTICQIARPFDDYFRS